MWPFGKRTKQIRNSQKAYSEYIRRLEAELPQERREVLEAARKAGKHFR